MSEVPLYPSVKRIKEGGEPSPCISQHSRKMRRLLSWYFLHVMIEKETAGVFRMPASGKRGSHASPVHCTSHKVRAIRDWWHVLKMQDSPPIQTLHLCLNHLLWTRHPCAREGYLAHPWQKTHPIGTEMGAVDDSETCVLNRESCIMINPVRPESASVGSFDPAKTSKMGPEEHPQ